MLIHGLVRQGGLQSGGQVYSQGFLRAPVTTTSTALYMRFILPPEPHDPAAACCKLNLGCLTPSTYLHVEGSTVVFPPLLYFRLGPSLAVWVWVYRWVSNVVSIGPSHFNPQPIQ